MRAEGGRNYTALDIYLKMGEMEVSNSKDLVYTFINLLLQFALKDTYGRVERRYQEMIFVLFVLRHQIRHEMLFEASSITEEMTAAKKK